MTWDTIENRWKHFMESIRVTDQHQAIEVAPALTTIPRELDITMPADNIDSNDLPETIDFAENKMRIHEPTAPQLQERSAPIEPTSQDPQSNEQDAQAHGTRTITIHACVKHKFGSKPRDAAK